MRDNLRIEPTRNFRKALWGNLHRQFPQALLLISILILNGCGFSSHNKSECVDIVRSFLREVKAVNDIHQIYRYFSSIEIIHLNYDPAFALRYYKRIGDLDWNLSAGDQPMNTQIVIGESKNNVYSNSTEKPLRIDFYLIKEDGGWKINKVFVETNHAGIAFLKNNI